MTVSSRIPALLGVCALLLVGTSESFGQELVGALAFGSRDLSCETPNSPGTNYTMVLHNSVDSIRYDAGRGYGYEVLYPQNSPYGDRAGYGIYGPFDDSPNGRNNVGDNCPEEIYDSFIGAKTFTTPCNAGTEGSPDAPCSDVEGIIFRVDVPNGQYRFVVAIGDIDNPHAHRFLAENGGSGPPENVGDHIVLVDNFDQAQFPELTLGAVGFDDKTPPAAAGLTLEDLGESPVLNVTEGYIRIHQLQGNSNEGVGGVDPNGGDIILLELWRVGDSAAEAPATTFGGAMILMAVIACLGSLVLLRRRLSPMAARS